MSVHRYVALPLFAAACLAVGPTLTSAQSAPLAPLPPALPRTHVPRPTTRAITAADLMTRLYIFADDSMRGRRVGRQGNVKATTYLAAELKRIGLRPAGDSGTYFQNLSGFLPVLAGRPSMRIGNKTLAVGNDFLPIGTRSLTSSRLTAVYGGPAAAPVTLPASQTAGQLVVFRVSGRVAPSDLVVPSVAGAAAVALVVLDSVTSTDRVKMLDGNLKLASQPEQPVILLSGGAATQLFGKDVNAVPVGTAGAKVAVAYTFVASARNVVAILPGSDPVLKYQYVAMGAHNDHIGWRTSAVGDHDSLRVLTHYASIGGEETGGNNVRPTPALVDSINAALAKLRRLNPPRPDSIFNGADDDGSGSVTMLEIAEYLASLKTKPKRSVVFVWHTGEEAGMLGSAWFTEHPTVPRDSIVVQLNADMVGRGDANDLPGGGPDYLQIVGARKLSTELGDLIVRVNQEGRHHMVLDSVTGAADYNRSDHYEYARFGIPVTFFETGAESDYHQVTDEPEYIDYPHMARTASFIADIAIHVGNLDHRLVVDHAKSD